MSGIDPTAESIKLMARQLKLPTFAAYHDILRQLSSSDGYGEFLLQIMRREAVARQENQQRRRIRQAHFPVLKTLDEFDFSTLKRIKESFIRELATCDFIDRRQNIVMIGNPGNGKSHLAIALGLKACSVGYKVLFKTAAALSAELAEASEAYRLTRLEKSIAQADLLIIDELSYISFNRQHSELLFKVVSDRSERGSIIVTTNLEFSRWTELFENTVMVAALVDRLTYKSHILDMNGPSYRMRVSSRA